MSFRSRLLLFFMIIVIVPMVAVALVLFGITTDSENGKADAAIAEGLHAAFSLYSADRTAAAAHATRVASDATLARALAGGNGAAASARLRQLVLADPAIRGASAYDVAGRPLAAAGSPDAIAGALAAPSTGGRRIGVVDVSTTSADAFARSTRSVTGLETGVARDGRVIAATLPAATGAPPHSGDATLAGRRYRGRYVTVAAGLDGRVAIGQLAERASVASRIASRRWLIGAILVVFLLLAMLSSIVVVRALQRQVGKFLEAAQRLARGDFSRQVPVEGHDEFAALGREFNAMSQQLAIKIEEVQRKRGELEDTIRRVGEAFAAGLNREEMVNIAVRTAVEACEAETGRALPIDGRRMNRTRVGLDRADLQRALEAAERRAFEVNAENGHDWISELEATGDGDEADVDQTRPARASVDGIYAMAVPLMARLGRGHSTEQVGVVSIARSGSDFDDTEFDLFAYLVGQAAVSIENVDLHETVRVQAVTDELTGLSNMRAFQEALDAEIERSRRFGTDVGLMMLDIDDFKHVNDSFGHQQGDIVLIEVARVLRNLSRDIDVPARYGGEEMAVVLPQTDAGGAELLAERMRHAIEALRIERLDGKGQIAVTASFGVASMPTCARDKETLIHEADSALYRAKRAGKNRVSRGEPVTAES